MTGRKDGQRSAGRSRRAGSPAAGGPGGPGSARWWAADSCGPCDPSLLAADRTAPAHDPRPPSSARQSPEPAGKAGKPATGCLAGLCARADQPARLVSRGFDQSVRTSYSCPSSGHCRETMQDARPKAPGILWICPSGRGIAIAQPGPDKADRADPRPPPRTGRTGVCEGQRFGIQGCR
jgi:hypothetical protein